MTGLQIGLVLILLVLAGGVAWWALRTSGPVVPKTGDEATTLANQAVLSGMAPPPRNDDPRRTTSGQCIAPWHAVLQGDLSTKCDLPDGYVVKTLVPPSGTTPGVYTGDMPHTAEVGVFGAIDPTLGGSMFDEHGALRVVGRP